MADASVVPAPITIEEYLASSYEPDMEFVDGVLKQQIRGRWSLDE